MIKLLSKGDLLYIFHEVGTGCLRLQGCSLGLNMGGFKCEPFCGVPGNAPSWGLFIYLLYLCKMAHTSCSWL